MGIDMNKDLVCWKCGVELKGVILPLSRREVCASCRADQHVCKLCRHYDPRVADMCREDRAERVTDKERANFCDYFTPMPGAFKPSGTAAAEARNRLASLFGEQPAATDPKAGDKAADRAGTELQKLFGGDKKDDAG